MDKADFLSILKENNVDLSNICFNDNVKDDVFCVMEYANTVDVFYRERGKKHNLRSFSNLSNALTYLADYIIQMT